MLSTHTHTHTCTSTHTQENYSFPAPSGDWPGCHGFSRCPKMKTSTWIKLLEEQPIRSCRPCRLRLGLLLVFIDDSWLDTDLNINSCLNVECWVILMTCKMTQVFIFLLFRDCWLMLEYHWHGLQYRWLSLHIYTDDSWLDKSLILMSHAWN